MLAVEGLKARYGAAQILDGVSFLVSKGAVTALLGRNGAGKSTTFKAIIGLVRREGSVRFLGREIVAEEPFRIARAGLGYVPEDRRIFTELTVEENLMVGLQPPREGAPRWTPEKIYDLFPNLAEKRRSPRRRDERRRTADADDRPDADGQSEAPHARRAFRGHRAAHRGSRWPESSSI